MGGVSVRDVPVRSLNCQHYPVNYRADGIQADKFIQAYSAFLKRQGKLPIPGSSTV